MYVAAGDLNGDGKAEIVTGAGIGGGPHVRAFRSSDYKEVANFFAYDSKVRAGVRVAVGDLTGDGIPELITGPGPGVGPHIRGFNLKPDSSLATVYNAFAYAPTFTGGVFVG